MARNEIYKLTPRKRAQLEESMNASSSEDYRMRCQIVLLKADGLTNKEIAEKVGCNPVTVSKWVKRYHIEGLKGLEVMGWVFPDEDDNHRAINKQKRELAKAKAEWHKEMIETGTQGEAFNRFLEIFAKGFR